MKMKKTKGLGKGLSALFGDQKKPAKSTEIDGFSQKALIGELARNKYQPRTILDENKLRASAGIGISWVSPFGPVKFYLSKAILKENYDKKEIFRFSFGTTY